jgi:hypothetical protein
MMHDPADRMRSYELLAGLWPATEAADHSPASAGVTPARS